MKKKNIYLGILFLVFLGCFFGLQQQKPSLKYIPIGPDKVHENLNQDFVIQNPIRPDLQRKYQQAFIHDFVAASVQPAEAKDIILRVQVNRNHWLRILTMKSSGLFQLDQIARTTVERRPFWLESDQLYDIQFHYDPNWDQGEYGTAESRVAISSQNLPEAPPELNTQPVVPPMPRERLLVGPPGVQQGPSMIRRNVPRSGSSFNIGQYQTDAIAKVHRFYHPPKGFENAQVVAQFTVLPNGDVIDLRIMHSSTIPAVDNALLRAVRLAAPFASHPLRNYPIIVTMGNRHQSNRVSDEMKEYTRQLRARINPNWYPPVAIGERRVLVQFVLDATGKPYNIRILSSSGDPNIDASATSAIEMASNLPPLPPSLRGRQNNFVWIFDKHSREQ